MPEGTAATERVRLAPDRGSAVHPIPPNGAATGHSGVAAVSRRCRDPSPGQS